MMAFISDPTAKIENGATVRDGVEILQFAVVRSGARIGQDSRICSHCYIDVGVVIGERCKLKNGVYIYDGVVLEDEVFVGPGVVFTNDKNPKATCKHGPPYPQTRIERGVSIGARSVILPGVRIGESAVIGAGSVVTQDVPANTARYGNPAKRKYT